MKKAMTSLMLFIMGTCGASHLELDSARRMEFAQKRIALMKANKEMKQKQIESIEAQIKRSGNAHELSLLGAQLALFKSELAQLQSALEIALNSAKPLTT